MNKWVIALLVFSLTINIAAVGTLIYFWQKPGPPPMDAPWMLHSRNNRWPDGPPPDGSGRPFGMRPELQGLRSAYHEKMQPLARELDATRRDLMRLMGQQPAARDSIDLALQRITRLQGDLERVTVEHFLAMRAVLNEEQWTNLLKVMEKRMPDFRRGPRGLMPDRQR